MSLTFADTATPTRCSLYRTVRTSSWLWMLERTRSLVNGEVRTETFSVTLNASLYGSRLESARQIYSYFGNTLRARFVYRSSRHVPLLTLLTPVTPHRLTERIEATLGRNNDWRASRRMSAGK